MRIVSEYCLNMQDSFGRLTCADKDISKKRSKIQLFWCTFNGLFQESNSILLSLLFKRCHRQYEVGMMILRIELTCTFCKLDCPLQLSTISKGLIQKLQSTPCHERRTLIELCLSVLLEEQKAGASNGDDCNQKQASEYARKSDHVSEGPVRNSRRGNCKDKNRG